VSCKKLNVNGCRCELLKCSVVALVAADFHAYLLQNGVM
jgi:hypothetical protein